MLTPLRSLIVAMSLVVGGQISGGGSGVVAGGACTNQAVTGLSVLGVPTCTTLTSAYVNTSIWTGTVASGVLKASSQGVVAAAAAGTDFVLPGGALGTPSSGVATNLTGLPIGGITGLGTGVGTWFATPSSANFASALTGETGTGAVVFGTGPTVSEVVTTGAALAVANVGANSCGTTAATAAGNANAFEITVGATAGTQCRVTFPVAAANRRDCVVTNETTANLARSSYIDTTHSDLSGTFVAGDTLSVLCLAR